MSKVKQEFEIISEYKTLTLREGDRYFDTTLNQYALHGWRVVSTWTTTHRSQFEPIVYVNILLECQIELPVDEIHRLQNLSTDPRPVPVAEAPNSSNHREKWDKVKQRFGAASISIDNRNDDDEDDIPRQWP